jgi:hypothetical protein
MAKRDWFRQLNEIDTLNAAYCQMLTSTYKLKEFFPEEDYLVEVFSNYRSKKLNELTLFWCFTISFMHWLVLIHCDVRRKNPAYCAGRKKRSCSILKNWTTSISSFTASFVVIRVKAGCEFMQMSIHSSLASVSHKSGYIKNIRQAFDFVERYFREMFIENNKFVSTCIESTSAAKLLVELESSSVGKITSIPNASLTFFEVF